MITGMANFIITRWFLTFSALLLALFVAVPAQSQELSATQDSALMTVSVTNFDGKAHKGITVLFTSKEGGTTFQGESNRDGTFSILLPEGRTYKIKYKAFDETYSYKDFQIPSRRGRITSEFKIQIEPPTTFELEDVHFESGKAELRRSSYDRLDELVAYLKNKPSVKIEIAGHTDNVGNKQDNKQLSQERAQVVKNYLLENGIDEKRLRAKGYGESEPIATNDTPEGRQQNRRTEVRILER